MRVGIAHREMQQREAIGVWYIQLGPREQALLTEQHLQDVYPPAEHSATECRALLVQFLGCA